MAVPRVRCWSLRAQRLPVGAQVGQQLHVPRGRHASAAPCLSPFNQKTMTSFCKFLGAKMQAVAGMVIHTQPATGHSGGRVCAACPRRRIARPPVRVLAAQFGQGRFSRRTDDFALATDATTRADLFVCREPVHHRTIGNGGHKNETLDQWFSFGKGSEAKAPLLRRACAPRVRRMAHEARLQWQHHIGTSQHHTGTSQHHTGTSQHQTRSPHGGRFAAAQRAEQPRHPGGVAPFMSAHSRTPYVTTSMEFSSKGGVVRGHGV